MNEREKIISLYEEGHDLSYITKKVFGSVDFEENYKVVEYYIERNEMIYVCTQCQEIVAIPTTCECGGEEFAKI